MPAIQRITNANVDVEAKVNYFIDRFNHHVLYAGSEWHMELENQLSLIEKVYYQIREDNKIRVEYFDNYFAHEFFTDPKMWEEYPSYAKVGLVINNYNSAKDKKSKQDLLNQVSFHRTLEKLIQELQHNMPSVLLKHLMTVFLCNQPLEEHEHIATLNLIAKLIVSAGYFSGKAMSDLIELVNRIFFKGVHNFPFPAEVKKSERKKYLNANNLTNQISGFKSIMQVDPHEGLIILRAYGAIEFPNNYEFLYDGVLFLGRETIKIKKIRNTIDSELFTYFFDDETCIYIVTKLQWFSIGSVKQKMRDKVHNQLEYFSVMLKRNIELDNTNNFIIASQQWKYKGGSYNWGKHKLQLRDDQLDRLKDNPFEILSSFKTSPATKWLLSFEPLLVKAHKLDSVADYWQYLETLLPHDREGQKQVKDLVSQILILNEKEKSNKRIFQTMDNALDFFNGGTEILKIDYTKLPRIKSQLRKGKVPVKVRSLKYPFIEELVKEHDTQFNKEYYENAKKYYYGILTEAYLVRNFDVHSGIKNDSSIIKIQKSLPGMVARLRWLIFDAIKDNPTALFEFVIDDLYKKANLLLKG